MEERREGARHEVWFPVRLESEKHGERIAVTRDASAGGVLLSAKSDFEPGAQVTITFKVLPEDAVERQVHGRIVRVEPNHEDPDGFWPLRVAIAFDEAVPELEAQLALAEAERAKNLG